MTSFEKYIIPTLFECLPTDFDYPDFFDLYEEGQRLGEVDANGAVFKFIEKGSSMPVGVVVLKQAVLDVVSSVSEDKYSFKLPNIGAFFIDGEDWVLSTKVSDLRGGVVTSEYDKILDGCRVRVNLDGVGEIRSIAFTNLKEIEATFLRKNKEHKCDGNQMMWNGSKPLDIDLPADEKWVYEKQFKKKGWEESYKRVMELTSKRLTIQDTSKKTGCLHKQWTPESELESVACENIDVSVRKISENIVMVKSDCEIDEDGSFQYWLFELGDEKIGVL